MVTANVLFANESSLRVQPVYFTFLVPHDANKAKMGGGEEEDGAAAEQKGGEAEGDGGSGGSHGNEGDGAAAAGDEGVLPLQFQTYKEAARKYYLQHTDNNMVGGAPPEPAPP